MSINRGTGEEPTTTISLQQLIELHDQLVQEYVELGDEETARGEEILAELACLEVVYCEHPDRPIVDSVTRED